MTGGLRLGRLLGVPIAVHPTWLIAFFLVAWSLATGFFPASYPGWAPGTYWVAGGVAAVLLFASVVVHELSHALVARARGLSVRGITLFVFGGIAAIDAGGETPRDELLIAGVGPLTSLVLAGISWLGLAAAGQGGGAVPAMLAYLAMANALLGAFNLVPAFPLDGGRVLRAVIWAASGNLRAATNAASYAGQAVAAGLIVLGVVQLFGGELLGGVWTAFIGWFLFGAAESARGRLAATETFAGVRVADLLTPASRTVSPRMPLDEFIHEEVVRRGRRALPVVDDGRLVGIVSVTDAEKAPPDRWSSVAVGDVATTENLAVVAPGDPVDSALRAMAERGLHQVLVLDDGALVGLLTRKGVLDYLALHRGPGRAASSVPPRAERRPPLRPVA